MPSSVLNKDLYYRPAMNWPATYGKIQRGYKNNDTPRPILPYMGVTEWNRTGPRVLNDQPFYPPVLTWFPHTFFQTGGQMGSWSTPVSNAAYAKFRNSVIGDTSQIGVFLAEWKQSWGLAGQSLHTMASVARTLRKQLTRLNGRDLRRAANDVSSAWLQFWFGWSAGASDVFNAFEQLSRPLPVQIPISETSGTTRWQPQGGNAPPSCGMSYKWLCKIGAHMDLVNPNEALLAQVGLTNPVQVIWELVPFSFLVDWVADVSSFIGSFSDFAGIRLTKRYTSFYAKCYTSQFYTKVDKADWIFQFESFCHRRSSGILHPIPNWEFRANLGKAITRAASAVSLLNQELSGIGPYADRRKYR